jgi:hypothetical protein
VAPRRRPKRRDPETSRKRWLRLALGIGAPAVGVGLKLVHVLSDAGLTRGGGALNVVLALAIMAGSVVHATGWHGHQDANGARIRPSAKLWAIAVIEVVGALCLAVLGIATMLSDPHPWPALALTLPAWPLGWWIADRKLELASKAGLPTGTTIIQSSTRIEIQRKHFLKRVGSDRIDELVEAAFTYQRRAGAFSVAVVVGFVVLALSTSAQVAALVGPTGEWVNRPPDQEPQQHDATKPGGRGRTPGGAQAGGTSAGDVDDGADGSADAPPGDRCAVSPGAEIPEAFADERTGVAEIWDRVGEPSLGCAQLAERVPGTTAVYTVTGICPADGRPRAVAVVGPDHPAAVLMANPVVGVDPVMEIQRLAGDRTLRGASERQALGSGDVQIIYTSDGTWLLVREHATNGPGGVRTVPRRCADVHPGGGAYTALPPGLAHGWLLASTTLGFRTWPQRDSSRDGSGTMAFILSSADGSGRRVASAGCVTKVPHRCTIHLPSQPDIVEDDTTALPVDLPALLAQGPGSP